MSLGQLTAENQEVLSSKIGIELQRRNWGGDDADNITQYLCLCVLQNKTPDELALDLSSEGLISEDDVRPNLEAAKGFAESLVQLAQGLLWQQNNPGAQAPVHNGAAQGQQAQKGTDEDQVMGDITPAVGNIPTGPKGWDPEAAARRKFGNDIKGAIASSKSARGNVHSRGGITKNQNSRGGLASRAHFPVGPQGMLNFNDNRVMNQMRPIRGQGMRGRGQMQQPQFNGRGGFNQHQQHLPQQYGHQQQGYPPQMNGAHYNPNFFPEFAQAPPVNVNPLDIPLTPAREPASGKQTCKFDKRCKNADCVYAHSGLMTPNGITIDTSDHCPLAVHCQNKKCTASHPSPAVKGQEDCRFDPCTNPHCQYKHGPVCPNPIGECVKPDCKLRHVQKTAKKIKCTNNPCPYGASCRFSHEDGAGGAFEHKQWINPALKQQQGQHVSERKFVADEGKEELIRPEGGDQGMGGQQNGQANTQAEGVIE